ncbi:MAG: bifunctional folylpolyglutamate synthase/dihydrofolate synthase [Cyanobium sp.]
MHADLPAPVDLDDLLEPFSRRGVDLGLERLQRALAEGGDPQARFPAVQVAGTNGKGSICTFLHAILRAAGLQVASYRSPHLVSWCERCLIGDDWITAAQLRQDLGRWQAIGRRHQLTPFELLTAAAFDRFAHSKLDLVILEVGLGGRLDATTAHPQRTVLGFGSIGLDHREHLGDTLAAIASEKAGVMNAGADAFSAPQEPEVAAVLEQEAARRGCRLHWLEPLPASTAGGPTLGLAGQWQRCNGAVAVAMAQALSQQGWPIDAAAIRQGLAAAHWPGRLERRHWRGRPLLLDGAHNPPAAAALARELADPALAGQGPRRLLLGIQRHKEAAAMLEALLRPGDRARITPIPEHRCWDAASLAEALPQLAAQLEPGGDPDADLAWLTGFSSGSGSGLDSAASGEGAVPLVAGSLHLLGWLLPRLDPL